MCQSQSWTWRNFHQVPSLALFGIPSLSAMADSVTYLVTCHSSCDVFNDNDDNDAQDQGQVLVLHQGK